MSNIQNFFGRWGCKWWLSEDWLIKEGTRVFPVVDPAPKEGGPNCQLTPKIYQHTREPLLSKAFCFLKIFHQYPNVHSWIFTEHIIIIMQKIVFWYTVKYMHGSIQACTYIVPTAQKKHLHFVTNIYLAMQFVWCSTWSLVFAQTSLTESISEVSQTKHLPGGSGYAPGIGKSCA